ncbi:carbamoyl-phosphate synthase large subunit [Patulibacter sp. NPDC049589]|uniref:carbamoyl-phosphate synthase large subunit n=1 Tax=Patulibacter sp. NPDC049589 TaxID=3154731 RepID=UPI003436E91A
MPRRTDIRRIMILGSGPIVIGQAAEFDYSGAQACKVLREEGFEIVLVNSNPATIMTDPEYAEKTYVEPLLPGPVAKIIEKERPDALLPTLGGQTALNLAKALHEDGTLEKFGVELIGANYDAINCAEDRDLFAQAMAQAGLKMPASLIVRGKEGDSADGAKIATEEIDRQIDEALTITGLPAIVRPAFTLGGRGGGIARTEDEFRQIIRGGIDASPIGQVLVDQSVIGWGEYELEVMRDNGDNVVIVCSIENIDPMGVHTGDSVTVAPQQTLTDRLYQQLRDQAIRVIRAVGVETGGSNVQFAVNPETEEILIIEMNPRVSRSSALASKATGFPIAKIAARLAVGYRLDEITNDITKATPAAFEPTIDYVVVKWPRFAFEKFPGVDETLSTHMKSVGEAMSIGRTFGQAFVKALRSRELDRTPPIADDATAEELVERIRQPRTERYDVLLEAVRRGATDEQLHESTGIDRWYLHEFRRIALGEDPTPTDGAGGSATPGDPTGLVRTFKSVDTCAAEFAAQTPYFYSGWERPDQDGNPRHEVDRGDNPSVVILGSGPNRIGQGIEFDYCCVHAATTVKDSGRDAVMINCNPETVSTDYDTSTRLYFEPLTLDDVLGVLQVEQPEGVIVQFGGQTPLRLAQGLQDAGIKILGTSVEAIDRAEERTAFGDVLSKLGFKAPPYATAQGLDGALAAAEEVGFPLLVRPSYVLGGRAMEIVYGPDGLTSYLEREADITAGKPIFLDRFLENAIEVDVDALCDRESVWVGGIMQHVEEAGIHSGDSACALPPFSLSDDLIEEIRRQTRGIALELGVCGLINIQFAVYEGEVYVIEANPRASRTVPFVSKAIGVPLAKMAVRIMLGETIADLQLPAEAGGQGSLGHVAVKEAVLPFDRFVGSDGLLGPEMRSTGEVMGVAHDFPSAFAKASAAAGSPLPDSGTVFVSVTDADKPFAIEVATRFHELGFSLLATAGTRDALVGAGIPCDVVAKLQDVTEDGDGPGTAVSRIAAGEVAVVINTPTGSGARTDGYEIRRAAITAGVPCLTTVSAGHAAVLAIASAREGEPSVVALQELVR